MSQRKPLAALAAVTAALALVVPAASASAATKFGPGPVAIPRPIVSPVYAPPAALCSALVFQLNVAELAANPILANAIGATLMDVGCGGAAI